LGDCEWLDLTDVCRVVPLDVPAGPFGQVAVLVDFELHFGGRAGSDRWQPGQSRSYQRGEDEKQECAPHDEPTFLVLDVVGYRWAPGIASGIPAVIPSRLQGAEILPPPARSK
jgi:hypothetical protein